MNYLVFLKCGEYLAGRPEPVAIIELIGALATKEAAMDCAAKHDRSQVKVRTIEHFIGWERKEVINSAISPYTKWDWQKLPGREVSLWDLPPGFTVLVDGEECEGAFLMEQLEPEERAAVIKLKIGEACTIGGGAIGNGPKFQITRVERSAA